mmetsp:Transcript_12897/g.27319  ORF Transcript_12897/g.27319 Transcript_12897/m.27319 type:complete len:662 (+) Transcript_12897:72-2057(+)
MHGSNNKQRRGSPTITPTHRPNSWQSRRSDQPGRRSRSSSRGGARAPNVIVLSVIFSSCALLILSLVPLVLLLKVENPTSILRTDLTVRWVRTATRSDNRADVLQYHCTQQIEPVKRVSPPNALNNNGNIYDLRSIGGNDSIVPSNDCKSHLIIRFRRGDNATQDRTGKISNLTLDMMRSDWTAAFDVDLSAIRSTGVLLENAERDDKVVAIPWTMSLYGTDSAPLWVAVYGMDEAGYSVDVQLAHECTGGILLETQVQNVKYRYHSCPSDVVRSFNAGRVVTIGEEYFAEPRRRPYYRLATGTPSPPRVTICTQLTINRLARLDAMAQNWKGPISAVVYIGYRGDVDAEMAQLIKYWDESVALQTYVDLHLVFDGKKPWFRWKNMEREPYPVNLLRQLAVEYANRTDYILYVEGDMVPIPRGHDIIASTWDELLEADSASIKEADAPAAFALPTYRLEDCPEEDRDCTAVSALDGHIVARDLAKRVPASKADLLKMNVRDKVEEYGIRRMNLPQFHYDGWEEANGGSSLFLPYDGTEPRFKYVPPSLKKDARDYRRAMNSQEPYVIVRKKGLPPYDVLYWSIEGDKRTQIYDMVVQGYKFSIHRDVFLINYSDKHLDIVRDALGRVKPKYGWDWIAGYQRSWRHEFITLVHKLMTGNDRC